MHGAGAGEDLAFTSNTTTSANARCGQVNCGKGGPWIPQLMAEEYGLVPGRTLMVGDGLDTDIAFGAQTGMQTLLPLTGVTAQAILDGLGPDDVRPDFVVGSLADALLRP